MLNRTIIRQKVMQNLYRYLYFENTSGKSERKQQLEYDLHSFYRLYLYLLTTLEEIADYVNQYHDKSRSVPAPIRDRFQYTIRFSENFIIQKLTNSSAYSEAKQKHKIIWDDEEGLVRRMFLDFKASELYQEYIHSREKEAFEDEEILIYFLKHYPNYFNLFRQHLDAKFIHLTDDLKVSINMAVKTIRNIASDPKEENFLVPFTFEWGDKFEYAQDLLETTLQNEEEYKEHIEPKITQWAPKQVARIDTIILRMALAEMLHFPTIPNEVTINEYLDLTKQYSSPGSKKFINAILDRTRKGLVKPG